MNAKSTSDSQNVRFPGQIGERTMTEVMGDTIEAKLVASGDRDASTCIVCDRYSCSLVRAKASRSSCVCPSCLKSADFDAKLAARAEKVAADAEKVAAHAEKVATRAEAIMTGASKLREHAATVRMLIGKVKAPTFEEWLDAEAQEDVMARSRVTKEERKKTLAKEYDRCGGHEPADWDETEYRAQGETDAQGNAEDAARDQFFRSLHDDGFRYLALLDDADVPF
jgi:hypothetical protein